MTVWMIGIEKEYSTYEELRVRRLVGQGWPDLGDLSHLIGANDVPQQIKDLGESKEKAQRTFANLLAEIQPHDLVLAFEGLTLKGICEVTKIAGYVYDLDGTMTGVRPDYFGKTEYNYAHGLYPVLWIDWKDFNSRFMNGGQVPVAPGQGVVGIQRSHQADDVVSAWQKYIGS